MVRTFGTKRIAVLLSGYCPDQSWNYPHEPRCVLRPYTFIYRDEDTVQSVPTRRGAFAGWDAQGGELPYTGGCMETSWRATLLGRGPGERGGALGSAGAKG